MPGTQPTPEAVRLARRLRELREREFIRLTQAELGKALAVGKGPVSTAAISTWENPASGRLSPAARLEASPGSSAHRDPSMVARICLASRT